MTLPTGTKLCTRAFISLLVASKVAAMPVTPNPSPLVFNTIHEFETVTSYGCTPDKITIQHSQFDVLYTCSGTFRRNTLLPQAINAASPEEDVPLIGMDIIGYTGYYSMAPSFFRQIAENPVFTTPATTSPLPTPEVSESTSNSTDRGSTNEVSATMTTATDRSRQEPVARFYNYQNMGIDSQLLSLGRPVTRDNQGNRYLFLYNKTCAIAPDNTVKWCKHRPFEPLPSPMVRDFNGEKTLYSLLSIPEDCQGIVSQNPSPPSLLSKSESIVIIEELERIESLKYNTVQEFFIRESIDTETTLKLQPSSEGLIEECLKKAGKNSILAVSAMDAETGKERFPPFFSTPSNNYLPYAFPFNVFSQQTGTQYIYTLSYGPDSSATSCSTARAACKVHLYGLDGELTPVLELSFPHTGSQNHILTPMTLYENKRGNDELTLVIGDTVHHLEIKPGIKKPLSHWFFSLDSGYDSDRYNAYRQPVRTNGRLFILRDQGAQGHRIFEFNPLDQGSRAPIIHHLNLSGLADINPTVLPHGNGFLATFQQDYFRVDVQWFDTGTEGQIRHTSIASFVMNKNSYSWSSPNFMFIGKAMILNKQLILSGVQSETRNSDGYDIESGVLIFMDWQPDKISNLAPLEIIPSSEEQSAYSQASGNHRIASTITPMTTPLMALLLMNYARF